MSHRLDKIKKKLRHYGAWENGYLDELVDSECRTTANKLSHEGPEAQVLFLLKHGWSVESIVNHGKRTASLIRQHAQGLVQEHKHKHHKRR